MTHPIRFFPSLTPAALLELRLSLQGTLVTPHEPEYEALRGVWNAAADVFPKLIVQARNPQDVARTLRFARKQGLPLAVRSGGHSPAAFGTVDGGVVLDLSRMKDLQIEGSRVRVQPGLTWGELAWALFPHGLAITSGDTASVGVGGLTLGGGIGWMVRQHGLAADRLRAVELVSAEGAVLRASEDENAELFWALRGGGGNFGVVTALEFEAHPAGEAGMVLAGAVFYDAQDAEAVLEGYARHALSAPEALSTQLLMISAPPLPFLPAEAVGRPVVAVMACWNGPHAEGQAALAPLRTLARPLADVIDLMPYPALFALSEVGEVRGMRHHSRTQFFRDLGAEARSTLIRRTLEALNPGTLVQLRALGGTLARIPAESTAFAHRDKRFLLLVSHMAPAATPADPLEAATAHIFEALREQGSGTYGNFLGLGEEGRVDEAYPQAVRARLERVKAEYDPHNLFARGLTLWPALRELV